MSKEIFTFGDNEIEKNKFYCIKVLFFNKMCRNGESIII